MNLVQIEKTVGSYAAHLTDGERVKMYRRVIGFLRLARTDHRTERQKMELRCAILEAQRITRIDTDAVSVLIQALTLLLTEALGKQAAVAEGFINE
jgi:hypothetical protein